MALGWLSNNCLFDRFRLWPALLFPVSNLVKVFHFHGVRGTSVTYLKFNPMVWSHLPPWVLYCFKRAV